MITNEHVVEDDTEVQIYPASGGGPYTGEVIGVDELRDLAVVRICCNSGLRALALAEPSEVRQGAEVVAFGYPYRAGVLSGLSVSDGIISSIGYYQRRDSYTVQTTAESNPGNSGGPLVNMFGKVVGTIRSSVDFSPSGRPIDGIAFAVAARTIRDRLSALEGGEGRVPTPTSTIAPTPSQNQVSPPHSAIFYDGWVTVNGDPTGLQGFTLSAKVGDWVSESVTIGDGTADLNGFENLTVNPPSELIGNQVTFLLNGTVESTTSDFYAIIEDDGTVCTSCPIDFPQFRTDFSIDFPRLP